MKKLMALCLSLLMVLSMCSFTVFADGEATVAVTFADIANGQPQNFVTGNLVLGTNDVITSSNEAVIATNGTVTRPIYEDAKVTLTINGGDAVEVTVKAKTTNVLYANDFSTGVGSEWSLPVVGTNTPSAVANGVLNMVIGDTTSGRTDLKYSPAAISGTRPVTFQFDMSNITDLVASGADIRISGSRYDAEGNKIGGFSLITVARCNSASGFSSYWPSVNDAKKAVTMKYSPATGEFWFNGTKSTNNLFSYSGNNGSQSINNGYTTDDVAKVDITSITITNAAGGCTGTFDMDDFVQYEDVPVAEALESATDAEKLANYSSLLDKAYVANGGNLDALTTNLKFTADGLPAGVSLTWTSTNPAIAADGTVKRPILEAATATITGTLKAGEKSISKSYNVTILPLTMSYASEVADAENLTPGTSFAGATGWTSSIKTWERMDVGEDADGNNYFSICASSYQPSGNAPQYTFQSYPTALAAGETLVFEAKVRVPVKAGLANWGLLLNDKEIAEFIYYNNYLYDNDYDLGSDGYYGPSAARSDKNITANTWYNIKFEIAADTAASTGYTVKCYIDNVLVGTHKTLNAVPANITSAKFQFTGRSNMDSTTDPTKPVNFFHTDDIKLYKKLATSDVLAKLSDAEKVDFYKQLIAASNIGTASEVGAVLDLDNGYADYTPATYGVAISWASDNTAYVANDGTVNKLAPHKETATVNMTATITAGSASDTVVIPVTVGSETTLIDSVDYDDTSVSVGSNATYGTDAEHGSIVTMTNPTEGTHKASGTLTSLTGAGRYDRVIFEADMKYTDDGAAFASGGIVLKTIAGKSGATVYLNYTTNKVQLTTTAAYANGAATGLETTAVEAIYYQMPASIIAKGEGAWVHLMVDHNVLSQTYDVYLDGVLVNDVPILQSEMDLGENSGTAIRGYSLELSGKGTVCVDNLELYKYTDANAVEVNAALNAALIEFGSDIQSPVLVNQDLPAKTIGRSWVTGSRFNRDLNGTALKPTKVSTYTYVADGPQVTYAIDGKAVTAIDVDSPKEVQLTITASANGITESKTVTRKVAPVAIRDLALGTASCLNGAWIEGAEGTEKLIVAEYLGGQLVGASIVDFADTAEWDSKTGTGDRFDEATGLVHDLSTQHPSQVVGVDQIKIFVVNADGITPVAYANAELRG